MCLLAWQPHLASLMPSDAFAFAHLSAFVFPRFSPHLYCPALVSFVFFLSKRHIQTESVTSDRSYHTMLPHASTRSCLSKLPMPSYCQGSQTASWDAHIRLHSKNGSIWNNLLELFEQLDRHGNGPVRKWKHFKRRSRSCAAFVCESQLVLQFQALLNWKFQIRTFNLKAS